jgi:hypothetical protein
MQEAKREEASSQLLHSTLALKALTEQQHHTAHACTAAVHTHMCASHGPRVLCICRRTCWAVVAICDHLWRIPALQGARNGAALSDRNS